MNADAGSGASLHRSPQPARDGFRLLSAVLLLVILGGPAAVDAQRVPHGAPTDAAQSAKEPLVALTPTEFNNTIADLFGFPRDGAQWPARPAVAAALSPARAASKGVFVPPPPPPPWPWGFPSEPGVNGFEGITQGQSPSSYQVEELHLAAMHFASFALIAPRFFVCEAWERMPRDEQSACAWASLKRLAQRAYRRPLRTPEHDRLRTFWLHNDATRPPDEAVGLSVAGILQSPVFHFRVEGGTGTSPDEAAPLTQWELASRLSYFLWDSMPDDQLFDAAESGHLATPAGIERQARRMLDDPKARAAVVHFHHQWLGTDRVVLIAPARRAFGTLFGLTPRIRDASDDDIEWPTIMGPVRHSMKLETELFVEQAIFDGDGTFHTLMTDRRGYMSDATAPIYGDRTTRIADGTPVTRSIEFMAVSIGREQPLTLYPVEFPREQRAGVLTLPSVLALGAYSVQPGPILRGVRVLERIACMDLGTPIQGAEAALPPDTLNATRTNRERTEAATASPACTTCHQFINPPGFGFEHYDAVGRWRARDNGRLVDASGTLSLGPGEEITFTDGIDLAHKLATSNRARDCYALHWTRYALGSQIETTTSEVRALQAEFRRHDSIKDLLVSIAKSDLFRLQLPATSMREDQ